ncbi:MAG: phospholipid carrier-dependent glycosyltransferase [Sandaracinaceae bacterium]|nr:phospholipid carrier-dependent glycosyltransferase [Sandaracinaceae bacterium]
MNNSIGRLAWIKHPLFWPYFAISVIAGLLRFYHLSFAPSTPWGRPDEEIFASVALGLFTDPNPHVGHTGWPELFFWVHHLVQRVLLAWWSMKEGDLHLGCAFALNPSRFIIPVRFVSAAVGWATVLLVMRLGFLVSPLRSPTERHAIALVAGWLYATNVLAVRDAHFAVSDTTLIFFFLWLLIAIAQGLHRGAMSDFIKAGVALGLAISTKWTGLTFAFVPLLAIAIRIAQHGLAPWPFGAFLRPAKLNSIAILLGASFALVAFIATSPSALSEPQAYWQGIRSHLMRYDPAGYQAMSYRMGTQIVPGWLDHLRTSLPFAYGTLLTWFGLLSAAFSIFFASRREAMVAILGLFTFFFWFGVVGRTTLNFVRYSFPMHPPLAVLSAWALCTISRSISFGITALAKSQKALNPAKTRWPALALPLFFLSLEPTLRSIACTWMLGLTDTRELAVEWLRRNVPDKPIESMGGYGRLYAVEKRLAERCEALLPPSWRTWVPRLDHPFDQSAFANPHPSSWRPTAQAALYPVLYRGTPPPALTSPILAISRAYLPCHVPTVRYDGTDPPPCYVERARFEPGELNCDARFDEQDHFYAPLWGFQGLKHIGPVVRIYENQCQSTH